MPTDPAPEKVAALAVALHEAEGHRWHKDPFGHGPDHIDAERAERLAAALNAAGYDVARIEEHGVVHVEDLTPRIVLCGREDCRWQHVGPHHPHGMDDFSEPVYMAMVQPWRDVARIEEGERLAEAQRTIEAMSGDAADLHDLMDEAAALRTCLAHTLQRTHDSGCATCDAARALLTADHELPSRAALAASDEAARP